MPFLDQSRRKQVVAWALYDWGNSAFTTAVIAGFFPIFFKQYWSVDTDVTVSSFRLGLANSLGSLAVMIMAPILGAIADQGALKKRFLLIFAVIGIGATGGMFPIGRGEWEWAVILYVIGGIGFAGANIFYDALIVDVSHKRHLDAVSALGYGLGYLGGGIIFGFCVIMTLWPSWFGLTDSFQAIRTSFLVTAVWWGVFSIPLFRYVHERPPVVPKQFKRAVIGGVQQLRDTWRKIRQFRPVVIFLAAYWLYIDGVDTVVRMAVDYGLALGFTAEHLITALLLVQFVGFPAALAFGWLGERLGPRTGILIGLSAYVGITIWGYFLEHVWEFYGVAVAIGLVQGGVQSLSRSLYARLIPAESAAEFFGFYNLLGKFAAVIGPVLMGWVAVISGSTRLSILSLLLLFVAGAALLLFVDKKAGAP